MCHLVNNAYSGNHERTWPGTRSFYGNMDFGGECGVLAETMFYVPGENRAKFWYRNNISNFLCFPFTYMSVFLYEKVDCQVIGIHL